MNTKRAVTAVFLLAVFVAGTYYILPVPKPEFTNTNKPASDATSTSVSKEDFLLEVHVNKTEYKYGEPVILYFNLTYSEGAKIDWTSAVNDIFHVDVRNETHSIQQTVATLQLKLPYTLSYGESYTGRAVMNQTFIRYYVDGDRGWGDHGPAGDFMGFSPSSTYYLEGSTKLHLSEQELTITATPIKIHITNQ